MVRHDFSYFLSVTGDDAPKVDELLRKEGVVPDFLTGGLIDPKNGEYQVDEDLGTIEEWSGIEDAMLKISNGCYNAILSLRINDEEDKSFNKRCVWCGGSLIHSSVSRLVDADEDIDKQSILEAVTFLIEENEGEAAKKLRAKFIDN